PGFTNRHWLFSEIGGPTDGVSDFSTCRTQNRGRLHQMLVQRLRDVHRIPGTWFGANHRLSTLRYGNGFVPAPSNSWLTYTIRLMGYQHDTHRAETTVLIEKGRATQGTEVTGRSCRTFASGFMDF